MTESSIIYSTQNRRNCLNILAYSTMVKNWTPSVSGRFSVIKKTKLALTLSH